MNSNETKPATVGGGAAQPVALTLVEVSRACAVEIGCVIELVQEGVLDPQAGAQPDDWRFSEAQLRNAVVASRLRRDLGVNSAGAALALQLLDEIETLRAQLNVTAAAIAEDSA
ncbi:MAG: hypothetical protein RLZ81_1408 [Pseudomonadota bacterium]|jgi:chaperone modulatory protein CbpM